MDRVDHKTLLRSVAWKRLDEPGDERCELWEARAGWVLEGRLSLGAAACEVHYRIECDREWRTTSAHVRMLRGDERAELDLRIDPDGHWWSGEQELRPLRGCVDLDLSATPSTNTLAIRRAGLPVGACAEAAAAWIRIPEWTIQPQVQRYTRLQPTLYRFEIRDFRADVAVDELGLVTRYGALWERAGVAP